MATTDSSSPGVVDKLFSPCGADSSRVIVGWVLYDWACSPCVYPFSILIPLLLSSLGDEAFGSGSGVILWSYVSVVIAIITAVLYMTVTAVIEYENIKTKVLLLCGRVSSIFLILFLFAFSSGTVYLAVILTVIAICSKRIADVAYDSLLDAVAVGKNAHHISTRGNVTGYAGMLIFIVVIAPILLIIYFTRNPGTLWIECILPSVFCGVWYLFFIYLVSIRVPANVYTGPPLPENMKGSVLKVVSVGAYTGFVEQLSTIKSLYSFPDLASYIISIALMADGASAVGSAAVLIASNNLKLSTIMIGVAALVGIFSGIAGMLFFDFFQSRDYLKPKHILLINLVILCLCCIFIFFVTNLVGVFILVVVAGSQIAPFSSFSRSMISKFIPTTQQSRFFSLYSFSQKGTSWLAPLVIGALTQTLGNNRYLEAVVYVSLTEAVIGIPFLVAVNVERAEKTRREFDVDHQPAPVEQIAPPTLPQATPSPEVSQCCSQLQVQVQVQVHAEA